MNRKQERFCKGCSKALSVHALDTDPPPAMCEIERPDNPAMSDYFCAECTEELWLEAEAADARERERRSAA